MTTLTVELEDVPKRFDEILEQIGSGTEVRIHRNGKMQQDYKLDLSPCPPEERTDKRILGLRAGGKSWIAEDFNDQLPDSFWLGES